MAIYWVWEKSDGDIGCKDKRGKEVRSGVYFIRLQTEKKSYQQKVIILGG
jgi:hypothetical protein